MTDESRYVKMADLLHDPRSGSNWADEQQEPQQQDAKPKNVWGQVKEVEAIDIAKVAEEDRKAKEAKAAEGSKEWTVAGSKQPGPKDETRRQDRPEKSAAYPSNVDKEARTSRPRNPLPDSPPFNAFVGNISYETTASDLEKLFENLNVKEARIVTDPDSSRSKGFGYVEFHDRASLEQALTFHNQEYNKRTLNVDVAAAKTSSSFGPSGGSKFGRGERNYDRNFGGGSYGDKSYGDKSYGDKSFGSGRGSGRGFGNRGPPGERPKLNINPPSKPVEAPAPASAPAPAPASASVASPQKKSDPFGFELDKSKLDKAAEDRLRMEQEREKKRKEEQYKGSSSSSSGRGYSNTKPYGEKSYGDKGYGDKSYGDKSYGDKSYGSGRGYGSKDSRPPLSKPQQPASTAVKPPPKQWTKQAETKKPEDDSKNKNLFSVLATEDEEEDQ